MSYGNVIMSSGWDTLPFLSHPDEIANFDFPQHAVALQRFRTYQTASRTCHAIYVGINIVFPSTSMARKLSRHFRHMFNTNFFVPGKSNSHKLYITLPVYTHHGTLIDKLFSLTLDCWSISTKVWNFVICTAVIVDFVLKIIAFQ